MCLSSASMASLLLRQRPVRFNFAERLVPLSHEEVDPRIFGGQIIAKKAGRRLLDAFDSLSVARAIIVIEDCDLGYWLFQVEEDGCCALEGEDLVEDELGELRRAHERLLDAVAH